MTNVNFDKKLPVFGCFLVGDNPDSNIEAVGTHFALIMGKLRTPNDKSVNLDHIE